MTEKDPTPPADGEAIGKLPRVVRIGGHLAVSETTETTAQEVQRTIDITRHRLFVAAERQAEIDEEQGGEKAYARTIMAGYLSAYGTPEEIYDLSVDEVAERRGVRNTHIAIIQLYMDGGVDVHPAILEQARQRLKGRDPFIDNAEAGPFVKFAFERGSVKNMDINHFSFSLAYLLGATADVHIYRLPRSSAS